MEKITPIIHLTSNCNLRCKYCYVSNHNRQMELLTHENMDCIISAIKKIIDFNLPNYTRIILHGGEPLLTPLSALELFFDRVINYSNRISFSIQTNLTLLDEDYCNILKKYHVNVGFSLDGCDKVQNQLRVDSFGKSTFEKVIYNYEKVCNLGLAPGAIITVNRFHINMEREILDFIESKHLKCNIRPAYPTGDSTYCMTPNEYGIYFNSLFDTWLENESYGTFYIAEFEEIVREVLGGEKECRGCSKSKNCSRNFLSIDTLGKCYPCNRLHGIPEFYLGNLSLEPLDAIRERAINITARRWEILKNTECASCNIQGFCHGGCPAIAWSVYGDYNNKDYFCESFQLIYNHVKQRIME